MRIMTDEVYQYQELKKNMTDLRGKTQNYEVLGLVDYPKWHCVCNCGKYFIATKKSIVGDGTSPIRGCLECFPANGKKAKKPKYIQIGERFGKLEVLSEIDDSRACKVFLCRCECGKEVNVSGRRLQEKSDCGCSKYEKIEEDWIGKKINRLTVLSYFTRDWKLYFICQCECGSEPFETTASNIKRGMAKSCGCNRSVSARARLDLTGQRFGRLLVKEFVFVKNQCKYYSCLCDCDNYKIVPASRLTTGSTKSCGCLVSGPTSHGWNPDLTDKERECRRDEFYSCGLISKTYKRDGFRCQKCNCKNSKDNRFNAHHMDSWTICNKTDGSRFDKCRRYQLDNLITLCERCHKAFNKMYGVGYTTMEQTIEFLGFTPKHLLFDPIYLGM